VTTHGTKSLTLGDCIQLYSGGTPSKSNPEYWGGDIPWVSPKDMKVGRIYSAIDTVTDAGANNGTRRIPAGRLLIVVRGMGLAKEFPVAITMREVTINQDLKAIECLDGVDSTFLYYWLRSKEYEFRSLADEAAHGTKRIQTDRLLSFPIDLPDEETQRGIARFLTAYDDLIENNRRRIEILEEMARNIYREWFVHFRFPGHENVQFVDSPLGPIPEGWGVKAIGDVVETLGGGTPSKKELAYWEGGSITWYSPSDLTATGSMFMEDSTSHITELGLQKSSARIFPAYSVMMTSRATIGVVSINTTPACTNQGFITCIPNEQLSAYYLYFWLLENKELITSLASGATFKEINKKTFGQIDVIVPDECTARTFHNTVEPTGDQIRNLLKRNTLLSQTRDFLLQAIFVNGQLP
jgi:type I restriction enzyme, S subunit